MIAKRFGDQWRFNDAIHEGGVAISFHTFNNSGGINNHNIQNPFEMARITAVCNNVDDNEKNGDLLFLTNNNSLGNAIMPTNELNTDYEKMRITYDGRVGIGTATPGYPLEIDDGAQITSSWSGYYIHNYSASSNTTGSGHTISIKAKYHLYSNGLIVTSDQRIKTNIRGLAKRNKRPDK